MEKTILVFVSLLFLLQGSIAFAGPNVSENDIFGNYNDFNYADIEAVSMCPDQVAIPMAVAKIFSILLVVLFLFISLINYILYKAKKNKKYLRLNIRLAYIFSIIIGIVYNIAFYHFLDISRNGHGDYDVFSDILIGVMIVFAPLFVGFILSKKYFKKEVKK